MGPGSDEVEDIRQQIEESRENLGNAVGALAYKADVKNRGKEAIEDKKEAIMEKVDDLKSKLPGTGDGAGSIGETIKSKLPDGDAIKSKLPDADAIKSKLPGGVGDSAGRIGDATPSKDAVKRRAQAAADGASEHPIAVVAGAAAAGLVAGLALPETDVEREKLGPAAQNARAEVQGRAQEAIEQAKSAAQDIAGSVADTVKEKGQEQGGKVGDIAEKAADKTREQVQPDS
jgi:gas vesicle protein